MKDKCNLKKTVDYIKSCKSYTAFSTAEIEVLLDLAERYLAVEAKMPEKKEEIQYKMEYYDDTPEDEYSNGWYGGESSGYNQAIEECTLAVTNMMDRERLLKVIQQTRGSNIDYRDVVDAIIESITKGE